MTDLLHSVDVFEVYILVAVNIFYKIAYTLFMYLVNYFNLFAVPFVSSCFHVSSSRPSSIHLQSLLSLQLNSPYTYFFANMVTGVYILKVAAKKLGRSSHKLSTWINAATSFCHFLATSSVESSFLEFLWFCNINLILWAFDLKQILQLAPVIFCLYTCCVIRIVFFIFLSFSVDMLKV